MARVSRGFQARWPRRRTALAGAAVVAGLAGAWWLERSPLAAEGDPPAAAPAAASAPVSAYPRPGPGLNLLAAEASPYLQLHARNPTEWYPWGEAAFERARREDKLVFLSVGYTTCYWCHVMERQVFSDPGIAAQLAKDFIAIKVDREERPDVDEIYMQATHLLTGSGGWPNSVFLTPDGKPIFAGTYFPPEDAHGRPGFPRVLAGLVDVWRGEREKVERVAAQVADEIARIADLGAVGGTPPAPEVSLRAALDALEQSYEPEHGGFAQRTKFPRPPALELLLTALESESNPKLLGMLVRTLDEMAFGGIHDHLAGGFHRYATEPTWSIPHFEKMLYDNAQLLGIYARAYTLTGRPLYRDVVTRTMAYLEREMSHPEGGFFAAQDAQVDGVEGASYVWTREEIRAVLGERADAFLDVYEVAPMREHPGAGVLRVGLPLAPKLAGPDAANASELLQRFAPDRAQLLARRAQRPQPLRDDKVLVAWNALAIRGLLSASAALGDPAPRERAERAARFLLARLRTDDGALGRAYIAGQVREEGVLDDYAFLADALFDLYRATGNAAWLGESRAIADQMLTRFSDPEGYGLFLTPAHSTLLVRPKPFDDNELPSGNAAAYRVLAALASETGEARYRAAADDIAMAAAPLLERAPSSLGVLVAARVADAARSPSLAAAAPAASPGSDETGAEAKRERFRMPSSADHVRASLIVDSAPSRRLLVRLAVDDGWHVNAHPASLPFLIPTTVEPAGADGTRKLSVEYPAGHALRPAFAPEAIQVYEGAVELPVSLAGPDPAPERIAVRFQACDHQICLPPSRIELALDGAAP